MIFFPGPGIGILSPKECSRPLAAEKKKQAWHNIGVTVYRPEVAETRRAGSRLRGGPGNRVLGQRGGPARELDRGQALEPKIDADKRAEYYEYWNRAVLGPSPGSPAGPF